MSLQVCIPGGCPNKCEFCVARMHENAYPNRMDEFEREYVRRLQYARENNYQTVVLTGTGEPMMSPDYLRRFGTYNALLATPFRWIELQTSGAGLPGNYGFLRNVGVSTISLSVANMFMSRKDRVTPAGYSNAEIMNMPEKYQFEIGDLCREIKREGFNLRLSLNMSWVYNGTPPIGIFTMAKNLGANQVTFKMLYADESGTPQAKWIKEHEYKEMPALVEYITTKGLELEMLSFGATRYDVDGMSVVVDHDCMGPAGPKNAKQIRYLILRPDCHLYTRWDSRGSLLF